MQKITALIIFIILLPILGIIMFLSFLMFRQNPIFIQSRGLRYGEKYFYLYKFRTLKSKSFRRKQENILNKSGSDSISRISKFLRSTGLDELPQLLNIIKGDMNFIGPRPLDLEDLEYIANQYPELHQKRKRIKSKPGIIGYWQVNRKENYSVEKLVEDDLYYESNKSIKLNRSIILKGLKILLTMQHGKVTDQIKKPQTKEIIKNSPNYIVNNYT